jgi:hypothetical protein
MVNAGTNPYVAQFSGPSAMCRNFSPLGSWINTVQSDPSQGLAPVRYVTPPVFVQNMVPPLPSAVMLPPFESDCRGPSYSTYSSCSLFGRFPYSWGR